MWKVKIRTKESLDVYATALLGLEGDPKLLLRAKELRRIFRNGGGRAERRRRQCQTNPSAETKEKPSKTVATSKSAISRKEFGNKIGDGTLFLSCWITYAQIEKLRAEKVMCSDLH